jgi:hypothetical protein
METQNKSIILCLSVRQFFRSEIQCWHGKHITMAHLSSSHWQESASCSSIHGKATDAHFRRPFGQQIRPVMAIAEQLCSSDMM